MAMETGKKVKTETQNQNLNLSPTRRYTIAQREPWSVPDAVIEVPSPKQAPGSLPTLNLLSTLMLPAFMIIGMIIVPLVMKTGQPAAAMIPMALVAIGAPLASLLSYSSQKKKYHQAITDRERNYRSSLDQARNQLLGLMAEQRNTLEREYPTVSEVARIGLNQTKRLWWRRPMDSDFLSIRLGNGTGPASFKVNPPRISDPNEPLLPLGLDVVNQFQVNPDIPLLLNLGKIGSVAVTAKISSSTYDVTRRMLLDLIVHHSPQDLNIGLIANTTDAEKRWSWLRWVPHTAALRENEKPRRINFNDDQIDTYLKWLVDEYNSRFKQAAGFNASANRSANRSSIVVFLDDNGIARQLPEICGIAQRGFEVGIYLVFVGGQNWPRECRSRLEIGGKSDFHYVETWDAGGKGIQFDGLVEPASIEVCEQVARSLAGLEVIGSGTSALLPESLRLSAVLGASCLEVDTIKNNWSANFRPDDLLQFPIGVSANRDQLESVEINLLPENKGGVDAYHTILIGTTGSGKSEFMKSLVMGAAIRYPPNLLNFFFLDFKGGATFIDLQALPHVNGFVNNLKSDIVVDRGIISIRSEIDRRQNQFSLAQATNIWGYNERNLDNPIPHLVLLLDEFARGLNEFPQLREVLDLLVRVGRSLGMYLILANQETNSEVDKLLNNVGWRIALKVGKDEEISMIDRALMTEPGKLPRRAGEGYLRSIKAVITRFQAGYAGFPVIDASAQNLEEFSLYSVESNGAISKFFRSRITSSAEAPSRSAIITEEMKIISNIKQATQELGIKPVSKIYLDPLNEVIDLAEVINESEIKPKFDRDEWVSDTLTRGPVVIPIGYYDSPSDCVQDILNIDFSQQDGHLWVVGGPGSGKAMTLTSMILSLALTYTPEEAQIYVLDFGSGSLRLLETLPHVGSVIRLQEKEKITRLLNFLDAELERRSSHETQSEINPGRHTDIFLFIYNYAEMRANYPDEADHISRYVRDGKAAGIHLVISTNRGAELSRAVASNIARKLVLQLSSKDEYMDVVGRMIAPISVRSEGRGYWVDEKVCECQIARPNSFNIKTLVKQMSDRWKGVRPVVIGTVPNCMSLSRMLELLPEGGKLNPHKLPLGIAYESLEVVQPDLKREMLQWLILGPRESGKSNFLICTAQTLLESGDIWDITAFSLKRSPLADFKTDNPHYQFGNSIDTVVKLLTDLSEKLAANPEQTGRRYLLIIDDLSTVFENGREAVLNALNAMLPTFSARQDVHIMASGLIEELRGQVGTPLVKLIKQNRSGMIFSKDMGELDWLGAALPPEYRKAEMPPGRGFFVSKGRLTFLQTPFRGQCHGKESND
jgi:S-DNA-T family DNA segregation ATPase FtsK/SpoIIIE